MKGVVSRFIGTWRDSDRCYDLPSDRITQIPRCPRHPQQMEAVVSLRHILGSEKAVSGKGNYPAELKKKEVNK